MAAPTLNFKPGTLNSKRPCVLTIAGFDPSGGAGVLADIKTFEANKVSGMAAVTGLTFQNEDEFIGVSWTSMEEIKKQVEILGKKHKFEFIKIGMVKNLEMLAEIVSSLKLNVPGCKIVWDPILRTSSGFDIHKSFDQEKLGSILKNIYLITPNTDEIKFLSGGTDEMEGAKKLSELCNVFLKGGHSEQNKGRDHLLTQEGKMYPFKAKQLAGTGKHGSGCVLSSAVTASLAKGNTLQRACLEGKNYVTKFLFSNKTLLGYHRV